MRAVAAAAFALVAGTLACAAPAVAAPSVVDATGGAGLSGELRTIGPSVIGSDDALSASVTIRNTGDADAAGVQLVLAVTSSPLTSTDGLAAFLEDPSVTSTREIARAPEPTEPDEDQDAGAADDSEDADTPDVPDGQTVEAGTATVMNVSADSDALALPADTWGVYGVEVSLVSDDGEVVIATGATTWADDDVPNLDVAVLAVAQGEDSDVATTLENTPVDRVAVAVDPTQLTTATAFDADLLEREVWRVPAGDPDVTSLAHGDGGDLYRFAVERPSGASILSADSLPLVSPVPALDDRTLGLARDAGAAAVITDRDTIGADELPGSLSVVEGSDVPILAPDPVLSEIVASGASDPAVDGALLAASALTEGGAVLVAAGQDGPVTPAGARLLDELLDAPWVTPTSITDFVAAAAEDAPAVDLPETTGKEDDLPADDVASLTGLLSDLTTFSSITDDPADALDDWGASLIAGVPAAGRESDALREASLTTALAGADATLGGVSIAEGSDLNLLADSGDVPITIMNSLDRDVTVTVELVSNSPNLIVEDTPQITVGAGLEDSAAIPVSAVSTANVTVVVGLETADGEPVSPLQAFNIRVRADWGTAGAAIFTGLLALLMIAGVIRTIRRGRKDTRLKPSPAPAKPLDDIPTDAHGSDDKAPDASATPQDAGEPDRDR